MTAASSIQSRQNPRYKQWQQYISHPDNSDCPWILVEGWRSIEELAFQRPLELLLFSDPQDLRLKPLLEHSLDSVQLSPQLLGRLSPLESPQGVMAFFQKPRWNWEDLTPWILYLDQLQDPGNLGTLLRTAQATAMFSLVTSPGTVSCFNSKVIRASAGALFNVPLLQEVDPGELKKRGYHLWAAASEGGQSLFEVQFESPLAVLIGNEGKGLTPSSSAWTSQQLHIPMEATDSLNASVAGSLILYEVFRQRKNHG